MKFTTYSIGNGPQLGLVRDDQIIDLSGFELSRAGTGTTTPRAGTGTTTMLGLIQAGPEAWTQAEAYVREAKGPAIPLQSARLLAPLPNPPKLVSVGLNYLDHCREQNVPVPTAPLVFTKFTSAIIGPGDEIIWSTDLTRQVDYEAELAVVIGKRARHVSKADALQYVFGYTIINDVSARDIQFSDTQWVRGKSLDTFCPMGPFIVTADEIPDPQKLAIRCQVNGRYLQDSSTSEMVFGVKELISELSKSFTFEPGDIISTGTPNGVGVFRKPQVFLENGDTVCVEIDGLGRLENRARTQP